MEIKSLLKPYLGVKLIISSFLLNPFLTMTFLICHLHKIVLRPLLPAMKFHKSKDIDGVIFNYNIFGNLKRGDSIDICNSFSQGAELYAHREYTRKGDHVVIVGGGYGISAVNSGNIVGSRGAVTVYEGGNISREIIQLIKWNKLEDIVEVKSKIVGSANELYGGRSKDSVDISPAELPSCDVLEMDCEGCEIEILENLNIRPRIIILELHPSKYQEINKKPLELLEQMNYDIVHYANQPGLPLTKQLFLQRLSHSVGDVIIAEFT